MTVFFRSAWAGEEGGFDLLKEVLGEFEGAGGSPRV